MSSHPSSARSPIQGHPSIQQYKTKIGLFNEMVNWYNLISHLIENYPDVKIFLKGGSILGLKVLIDSLPICGLESLQFNLIKDWDWTFLVPELEVHDRIVDLARLYNIFKEGETITVLRYHASDLERPYIRALVGREREALWEASVKVGSDLFSDISSLELPMTALSLSTTKNNISTIMTLSETLYTHSYDLESLTVLLERLKDAIIIPPHTDEGLFEIEREVRFANLSDPMIAQINQVSKDPHVQQFLVSMLVEPDRAFVRLNKKNLPKADLIRDFYTKHDIRVPNFLPNRRIKGYIGKLFSNLYRTISEEIGTVKTRCLQHNCQELSKVLEEIGLLFQGVNIPRISNIIITAKSRYKKEDNKIYDEILGPFQGLLQMRITFNHEQGQIQKNLAKLEQTLKKEILRVREDLKANQAIKRQLTAITLLQTIAMDVRW